MTGIDFGPQLYERNPLFYHDIAQRKRRFHISTIPERIPLNGVVNLVSNQQEKRSHIKDLAERVIIINTAMIRPKRGQGEWISLHNRGNRTVKLDGWSLVDGYGRICNLKGKVKSGESLKLSGRKKDKVKLSNSGGSLILYDSHHCVIDHVTWSKYQLLQTNVGIAFSFNNAN